MKIYLITDDDIERLKTAIDRNPQYGPNGGSSGVVNQEEREIYDEAHRFFNYQVRRWIADVTDWGKPKNPVIPD